MRAQGLRCVVSKHGRNFFLPATYLPSPHSHFAPSSPLPAFVAVETATSGITSPSAAARYSSQPWSGRGQGQAWPGTGPASATRSSNPRDRRSATSTSPAALVGAMPQRPPPAPLHRTSPRHSAGGHRTSPRHSAGPHVSQHMSSSSWQPGQHRTSTLAAAAATAAHSGGTDAGGGVGACVGV